MNKVGDSLPTVFSECKSNQDPDHRDSSRVWVCVRTDPLITKVHLGANSQDGPAHQASTTAPDMAPWTRNVIIHPPTLSQPIDDCFPFSAHFTEFT